MKNISIMTKIILLTLSILILTFFIAGLGIYGLSQPSASADTGNTIIRFYGSIQKER